MNIHSATIEAFKNIAKCEFEARGNHIILRGMNGSGKTAILEALTMAFFGKKLLPEDPVMHGQESSKIVWNIGNNEKLIFTITIRVTADNFTLKVIQYGDNGQKMEIKSPAGFLEKIMFKDALDPQAFFSKSDKDQLQMLYSILPNLKEQLDQIDSDIIDVKSVRSRVLSEKQTAEVDLSRVEYTPNLPEAEIDPADLMNELTRAREHNAELEDMQADKQAAQDQLSGIDQKKTSIKKQIERQAEMIRQMQAQMKESENELASLSDTEKSIAEKIATIDKAIQDFKPVDTADIENRIASVKDTNQKIRDNLRRKELEKRVEDLSAEFSKGLKDIRDLEEKRIEVIKSAQMPIEGLTVGEGCLMFPDPVTGEIVRLNSLSTGQKWRVAVRVLAAFLPENGMRVMIIKNVNDLDETNYNAMLAAADELGIQLVMHQTVFKSDNSQCEIVIEDKQ
jgi:DNA repair exonuclease SbcCD ATPase subunit